MGTAILSAAEENPRSEEVHMGAKSTKEIARFVCNTGYKDFPSEVVNLTKSLCLRQLGATLAGSALPPGKIIIEYVKNQKATPDAGILGAGFRTSAEYAAFANGTLFHATELEDVSFPEGQWTCSVYPAVFALGEKLKSSGRAMIEAIILGQEVAARIGLVCVDAVARGWLPASVWSNMGVAAAAAKLLKLDLEGTTMALSLAASQAGGLARQTGTGAHLFEAGTAARNGICAATLAKGGFSGNPTILEGRNGLCDLFAGQPDFEWTDEFRTLAIGMKKYPCCYQMHRQIDGMLELIKKHNISFEDVKDIEVGLNTTVGLGYLKYPQPETGEDARFSVPHGIAACLLDGHVFFDTFTDEKARDPKFKEARKKVNVVVHPEYNPGFFTFESPLIVRMKDGTEYKKVCVTAKGDPSDRLNDAEILKIYMDCIDFAGTVSRGDAKKAAEMVMAMDQLNDVSEVMSIFTFPKK